MPPPVAHLVPGSSDDHEWLVTNGIGAYASGTISGVLTRRYHGLLVAALDPPVGRTLLVAKVDDAVVVDGERFELFTNRWADLDEPIPDGTRHLESFELDGSIPTWTYRVGAVTLVKRVWMEHGANTTYLRYEHREGPPVRLEAKVIVDHRGFHETTRARSHPMLVAPIDDGVVVEAFDGARPSYLRGVGLTIEPRHDWYRRYFLATEAARGLDAIDDHLDGAHVTTTLTAGASVTLVTTLDPGAELDGDVALDRRRAHDREVVEALWSTLPRGKAGHQDGKGVTGAETADPRLPRLALAADQFIVRRGDEPGRSVIAGYHWFGDWGRDTMIALAGLTLATGRAVEAARILRTFAGFVDGGMLPNRIPGDGRPPEYHTIDATLWFFEAIRAVWEATGDDGLVTDLYPVLVDIVEHHLAGTRFDIHVDPTDGLLAGGVPGVQLTWMDAKVGDRVITPRIGKPVEVNALWHHALRIMAGLAPVAGADPAPFADAAERARHGFGRFWNPDRGYCYDVLDGPDGHDPALRPNQLLAVSLRPSPLDADRQRAVVEVCTAELLTPMGLRTLGPDEPDYRGRYGGSPAERDEAYHQGTVWPWLIGPYAAAHLAVYDDPDGVRRLLGPLLDHLDGHGLGSNAECADGDPPHAPRGAIAQAWSVAEVLRILRLVSPPQGKTP